MHVWLPGNILHKIGRYILTTFRPSSKSWFVSIRNLCVLYNLPHPLQTLEYPPSKESGKSLVKSHIVSYWEKKLRDSAKDLTSLSYFHPEYMSLLRPHPLFSSCGENSFEVAKSLTVSRMISGRYRSDQLLSHFDKNEDQRCRLCLTSTGNIEHLLLDCSALSDVRNTQLQSISNRTDFCQDSVFLILNYREKSASAFIQLLLDCSVLPEVIVANQNGQNVMHDIFKFGRTWCYNIHATRMKLLGRLKKYQFNVIAIASSYC